MDYYLRERAEEIYGIDINNSDLEIAKSRNPKIKYTQASMYKLPFKKGFFDAVVCVDVLEHLEDDEKAVREISRVLKKKGKAVITVPSSDFPITFDPVNYVLKYFNKKFPIGVWGYGHKRLYSRAMLGSLLESNGLKIKEVDYLSHALTGVFVGTYLESILQPLVKSDPLNKGNSLKNTTMLRRRLFYEPYRLITYIRDFIINADKCIFKGSRASLGLLVVAEKQKG